MDYRDNRQRWAESHQAVHFYAGQWCTFTPALTVPHLHEIADEGPTLQPGTILQNALPATLNSDYPVPVVSEDGAYHGTLSKRDMVEILTNSNASIQVA